jgi:hypothetical protein
MLLDATVYITNKSAVHDYSSASSYGAIRFVTTGNYPIFKTSRLQEEIIEALIHSSPEDFLLFSGSSTVSALAALVWLEMHGQLKSLLWDRGQNMYVLRVFVRRDLRMEIETIRDRMQGSHGRMASRDSEISS